MTGITTATGAQSSNDFAAWDRSHSKWNALVKAEMLRTGGNDLDKIPFVSNPDAKAPKFADPQRFQLDQNTPAEWARISLRTNLEFFKRGLVRNIYNLVADMTHDQNGDPVTEADKIAAANKIADAYIRAVDDFLRLHPGAKPELGERSAILGALGLQNEFSHPWCDDWAEAMRNALRDTITGDPSLKRLFGVMRGYWLEKEPREEGDLQHNWIVLYPLLPGLVMAGFDPPDGLPLLFLDPWYKILPYSYKPGSSNHAPLTHLGVPPAPPPPRPMPAPPPNGPSFFQSLFP